MIFTCLLKRMLKIQSKMQSGLVERDLALTPFWKKVIARMGRYGPMVQIGDTGNAEEKARFAKLKNTDIEPSV
jgi:topoisomerase IA-like protein